MCRGAAEVPGLACRVAGLADGAAGFDARGAKQTGDLLEVELDESRYRDLTDPPTDLSDEEKREVEQELKRDSISVPFNND